MKLNVDSERLMQQIKVYNETTVNPRIKYRFSMNFVLRTFNHALRNKVTCCAKVHTSWNLMMWHPFKLLNQWLWRKGVLILLFFVNLLELQGSSALLISQSTKHWHHVICEKIFIERCRVVTDVVLPYQK